MMQNCRKRKPTNKASPTFLMRACVHLCVCVLCVDWVMQFVCHLSLGVYGRSFFFSPCLHWQKYVCERCVSRDNSFFRCHLLRPIICRCACYIASTGTKRVLVLYAACIFPFVLCLLLFLLARVLKCYFHRTWCPKQWSLLRK